MIWKYEIDKNSSFTNLEIDNGTLFGSVSSHRVNTGSVYALRADKGSLLWHYQVQVSTPYGSLARAVVSGQLVYIDSQGNNATLYALKASDGSVFWSYPLGNGETSDIIPVGNTVYIGIGTSTESLYALQVVNGTLRWSYHINQSSSIGGVVYAGTTLYLDDRSSNSNVPDTLLALQTNNGTLLRSTQITAIWSITAP